MILGAPFAGFSQLGNALSRLCRAETSGDQPLQPVTAAPGQAPAVNQLNLEIMQALGGGPTKPGPFTLERCGENPGTFSDVISRFWLDDAVAALQSVSSKAGTIVLSDPNISIFQSLWVEASKRAGFEPRTILLYRHPNALGLPRGGRNEGRAALRRWLYYTVKSLECDIMHKLDRVVAFEDMLAQPGRVLGDMAGQFGLASTSLGDIAEDLRSTAAAKVDGNPAGPGITPNNDPLARLAAKTFAILRNWDACTDASETTMRIRRLSRAIDDAPWMRRTRIFVNMEELELRNRSRREPPRPAAPARGRTANVTGKSLIIHYHLFKNAGTSIDELLKLNFGERWAEREFANAGAVRSNVGLVTAYLESNPHLAALSSHTALLPPPAIPDVSILPILFVRHPIDRLRSAYAFQRQQQVDTRGATLAKETDFGGYLRALLPQPRSGQARNFQASRLAHCEPPRAGSERERALRALERLPFVGLVEAYEKSLSRLAEMIRTHFPDFRVVTAWKNATSDRQSTLEQRLAATRNELGSALFEEICAANAVDLEIYEIVRARYAAMPD